MTATARSQYTPRTPDADVPMARSTLSALIARAEPSFMGGFLHSLPKAKQYAALSVVCVGMLQISILLAMLLRLAVSGFNSFTSSNVMAVLMLLLVGTVMELVGVVYILLPSPAPAPASEVYSSRSPGTYRFVGLVNPPRPSDAHRPSTKASKHTSFSDAALQRHGDAAAAAVTVPDMRSSISSGTSLYNSSEWSELGWRLEALGDLKAFMQGLDRPASTENFIHGAATAIQGIFPGVSHASFCLLNSSNTSVNVYTFLGEGAQTVPYTSVAVAPGTLINYVIHTCQPVFIPNIALFQRPYSDLQFMHYVMGLHSMTCLPLVIRDRQVLGVLRLGFEEPRAWEEPEKRLAEELALVLSSSTPGLGGAPSAAGCSPSGASHPRASQWSSSARSSSLLDVAGLLHPPAEASQQLQGQSSVGPLHLLSTPESSTTQQFPSSSADESSCHTMSHPDGVMPPLGSGRMDPPPPQQQQLNRSVSTDQLDPSRAAAYEQRDYDLKRMEIIGRGGFGSVFKATWRGKLVAVKVVEHGDDLQGCCDVLAPAASTDAHARRAALLEGAMSRTIKHPNVVQTYDFRVVNLNPGAPGLSLDSMAQETHIIMDLCDGGSLQDAIKRGAFASKGEDGQPDGGVNMEFISMTLAEIAVAMAYLHAHRITHRDLKPKNILLKASNKDARGFRSMVSDFGLSQVLPENDNNLHSLTHGGTVTHMPPELIEDGKVYQQGDAYAFGMVMWEMFTAAAPYASMTQVQIMVAVVTHDLRPKFPDSCPEWFKSLANKCWRKDPMSRPSFQEIANFLLTMIPDKSWSVTGEGSDEAHATEPHGQPSQQS